MTYIVAWDHDSENPNPHAWVSDGVPHDPEEAARAWAARVRQEGFDEGYTEDDINPHIIIQT